MKKDKLKSIKDFTKVNGQIVELNPEDFIKLPHPYEDWVDPPFRELTDDQKNRLESSLDGFSSLAMPKPQTDEEKEKLKDLKFIFFVDNLKLFLEEIIKYKVNMTELKQKAEILKTLILELEKFEPHILLYGKKQIYWDIQSYLHIVLRHVKQLQIGTFKAKSSFPYKHKDLEVLIEQVLGRIADEIRNHFEKYPEREFRRGGKMSVLFNNDYYSINIDRNGRLTNIYINN